MSAPTEAYRPPTHHNITLPPAIMATFRGSVGGYVDIHPADIPAAIRSRAIVESLGGPADDDGGHDAPRVITIYYLMNWREIGVPAKFSDYCFSTSMDEQPSIVDLVASVRNVSPRWAACARVYPVLR